MSFPVKSVDKILTGFENLSGLKRTSTDLTNQFSIPHRLSFGESQFKLRKGNLASGIFNYKCLICISNISG
jgi:hypothetical protein